MHASTCMHHPAADGSDTDCMHGTAAPHNSDLGVQCPLVQDREGVRNAFATRFLPGGATQGRPACGKCIIVTVQAGCIKCACGPGGRANGTLVANGSSMGPVSSRRTSACSAVPKLWQYTYMHC